MLLGKRVTIERLRSNLSSGCKHAVCVERRETVLTDGPAARWNLSLGRVLSAFRGGYSPGFETWLRMEGCSILTAGGRRVRKLRGSKVLANRARGAQRAALNSCSEALRALETEFGVGARSSSEQFGVLGGQKKTARSSSEFLGAPHSE